MNRSLTAIGLALFLTVASSTRATETEHFGIRLVPTPAKVAVDGQTNDWDLSGGMLICGDVETARDKVSLWFHGMYDAGNLYLLARWNDETPLNNPGVTAGDFGWNGDSLQFRIITGFKTPQERVSHFTCWQGRDGANVIDVAYGRNLKEGHVRELKQQGAAQAFAVAEHGKGYAQEIAIPWKAITLDGNVPKAGDAIRLTVECNFTIGAAGRVSYKDSFQSGVILDRIFTFRAYDHWGSATLARTGQLTLRPVRLTDGREFPSKMQNGVPVVDWAGLIKSRALDGFKPLRLQVPEDGFVSLNIRNADGEVVRQLLSAEFVTKGEHEFLWDGLSTFNYRNPGEPVPPGNYSWQAIHHTGIGLRLKGWACNAGDTPWDFPAGRGNWGGDHGAPSAVAVDGKQVYLGWSGAEAGKALLGCNFDGQVQWNNTHGGIGGASAVAVDGGTVYALNYKQIYRVNSKTGVYNTWTETRNTELPLDTIFPGYTSAKGQRMMFAAVEGKLYVSSKLHNEIIVIDGKSGKVLERLPLTAPENLTTDPADRIFVVTHDSVLALPTDSKQFESIITGLQNASAIAVDGDGKIFVGVGEPNHQIQVYSAEGKLERTIGRKGGRNLLGPWTPDSVRFINSLAIDARNQLWVVEHDMSPKRISVWNAATGELIKELFGPAQYGAPGGAVNPDDPLLMVGQGCEWRLDPQTGRATCLGVITRDPMGVSRFCQPANGKLYLVTAHQWLHGPHPIDIYERLGDANYKLRASFRYTGKSKEVRTTYWADENGDGESQSNEEISVNGSVKFGGWYLGVTPDLTFYTMSGEGMQFKVNGFTDCGAPRFELQSPARLAASGLGSTDGELMLSWSGNGEDFGWVRCRRISDGKSLWSYPNNFVGVHGSHKAPPPEPGLIRGAYPACGTAKLPDPVGNAWFFPTNLGEWHVLTDRGFYLTRLFLQGDSLKIQWPETAAPGAILDNVPPGMGGEDFGGSITLANDGKLYVQAGKTAFWNVEVVGIESVKELPGGTVSISAKDSQLARTYREKHLQQRVAHQELVLTRLTPEFTGNPDRDFSGASFVHFQKQVETQVKAAAAWDDNNLYLAWDVKDSTPWINGANDPAMMYLHGDTVDLQLATDSTADPNRKEAVLGDLRLSIGDFQGQPRAMLYRRVSKEPHPRSFSSGVIENYKMESVTAVDAEIHARITGKDHYVVEAAIPLESLGLRPAAEMTLRGDLGVTHGDTAGQRTRLRTYWTNQHTGIVDDAVFELQMEPNNWGTLILK